MAACLALVVLYIFIALLNVTNNYITIAIGQRMVNELRAQMFDRLQRLSLSFHRRREVGDLMVRIAYDTFSLQTIAMNGIFPVVSSLVMLGGMFIVMLKMDATLTLAAVAVVPLLIILMIAVSNRIDQLASGARVKESRLYTVAHQALAGIHVVQAFTREEETYREFVKSSSESLGETLQALYLSDLLCGCGQCDDRDRHRGGHLYRRAARRERQTDYWRSDCFYYLSRFDVCAGKSGVSDLRLDRRRQGGTQALPRIDRDRAGYQGSPRTRARSNGHAAKSNSTT